MARFIILLVCFVFLVNHGGFTQTIFRDLGQEKTITLEVLKPDFGENSNASFLTSSSFLTLHLPISNNLMFTGELPFSYAKFSSRFSGDRSGGTIGNPYIGFEYRDNKKSTFMGEFGVRIPLTSDESIAAFPGLLTDFIDRAEAFAPKIFSIHTMANYVSQSETGVTLRVRSGPLLWLNTEDNGGDTEVFLLYGATIGYNGDAVRLQGGFNGRWLLSNDGANFGESTLHQIGFSANFGSGNVRPGVSLRVPLDDDFQNTLDLTLGLDVTFQLK